MAVMDGAYDRLVPDYEQYLSRRVASAGSLESADPEPPPGGDPRRY